MSKQTLCLDYSSSKSLLYFLIEIGIITHYYDGKQIIRSDLSDMNYYLYGNWKLTDDEKSALLHRHFRNFYGLVSLLTLYDEILVQEIHTFFKFDTSNLEEIGIKIISPISIIPSNSIVCNAKEIFELFRRNIISDFMQDNQGDCFDNHPNPDMIDYYISNHLFLEHCKGYHFSKYRPSYSFMTRNGFDHWETRLFDYLDQTFNSIIIGLLRSNATHYSDVFKNPGWSVIEPTDSIRINDCALVADFSSGIGIIPHPETFKEIVTWRNDPNMISFRRVFSAWVKTIREGKIDLANKMQNDVRIANQKLDALDKIEYIEKSTFVSIIKASLSLNPYIASTLTAVDFIKPYVIDAQRKKNSWILLPGFQSHYRSLPKP